VIIRARLKKKRNSLRKTSQDLLYAVHSYSCKNGGEHALRRVPIRVEGTNDLYKAIICSKCGSIFHLENETTGKKVDSVEKRIRKFG
jgi:hypothetical protein